MFETIFLLLKECLKTTGLINLWGSDWATFGWIHLPSQKVRSWGNWCPVLESLTLRERPCVSLRVTVPFKTSASSILFLKPEQAGCSAPVIMHLPHNMDLPQDTTPPGVLGEGANSFPSQRDFTGSLYLPLFQTPASLSVSFYKGIHLDLADTIFFLKSSARLAPWTGTHEAVSKTISLRGTIYSLLCACQQSS